MKDFEFGTDVPAAPSERAMSEHYRETLALLALERDDAVDDGFERWENARRRWATWANLTRLRYRQDTRANDARLAASELDRRSPQVIELDAAVKRRLLDPEVRRGLEPRVGAQAFALWDTDITTFDPAIAADTILESDLAREYVELLADASTPFEGADRTLAQLAGYASVADRRTRHGAERARWQIFSDRAERLDALFDELVRVRHRMARALGYENYLELGYRRMRRTRYGPAEVARYRDEVARVVVPKAARLVRDYGARRGYEPVYFWDESVLAAGDSVAPRGDATWILARAEDALAALHPSLAEFARIMRERDLIDVESRPGKALGAFCTHLPTRGEPFVFANFNGTRGDVRTLMHEFGHAFSAWSSREKATLDYVVPTFEAAEVHSMSLEYLSWPQMELFFGEDARSYRRDHAFDALLFLPYGVAVDHFQHLVYEHPSASPAERRAMWREMERRYLPWRDYGDLAHPLAGGLWQEKRHLYLSPLYYIDYTLALGCALQFRARAERDREGALADYLALCARGGEAEFGDLIGSANLASPFEEGVLDEAVGSLAHYLST